MLWAALLLTAVRCSSRVVLARPSGAPAGDRRGRPGGAVRARDWSGRAPTQARAGPLILAPGTFYAEGLTGRVPARRDDPVTVGGAW
ncbi:hypothetical protein GCM10027261_08630 [Geodermatophilus arenarius]